MNEVQNFLFEGLGIRGSIIRLKETWRQVIAQHEYPQDILQLFLAVLFLSPYYRLLDYFYFLKTYKLFFVN